MTVGFLRRTAPLSWLLIRHCVAGGCIANILKILSPVSRQSDYPQIPADACNTSPQLTAVFDSLSNTHRKVGQLGCHFVLRKAMVRISEVLAMQTSSAHFITHM